MLHQVHKCQKRVDVVVRPLMMYSNVIVGITISRGSFVFSQTRVKVSTSLTNIGSLAVGAFDLVDCSRERQRRT